MHDGLRKCTCGTAVRVSGKKIVRGELESVDINLYARKT